MKWKEKEKYFYTRLLLRMKKSFCMERNGQKKLKHVFAKMKRLFIGFLELNGCHEWIFSLNFSADIQKSGVSPVVFKNGKFAMETNYGALMDILEDRVEIIGNIYENPELLETLDK